MPAVRERRSEQARTEPEGRNPGFRPTARIALHPGYGRSRRGAPAESLRSISPMLASAKWLAGSIYGSRKVVRRARSVRRGVNLENCPVYPGAAS